MMTDRRPYIVAIIFVAAIAVFTFIWLTYIVPGYTERELDIRNRNAAMMKDITEIESMNGSTEVLDKKISDAEARISEIYESRKLNPEAASDLIMTICEKAGVDEVGIDIGAGKMLSAAGVYIPALYTSEVTILFQGSEKRGAAVIRGLEIAGNADFEVTAFVYRVIPPPALDDEEEPRAVTPPGIGEWLITAQINYYQSDIVTE